MHVKFYVKFTWMMKAFDPIDVDVSVYQLHQQFLVFGWFSSNCYPMNLYLKIIGLKTWAIYCPLKKTNVRCRGLFFINFLITKTTGLTEILQKCAVLFLDKEIGQLGIILIFELWLVSKYGRERALIFLLLEKWNNTFVKSRAFTISYYFCW